MIDEDLWIELGAEHPRGQGLVRRRVREESARDLFIGVTAPDKLRVLVLSVAPDAASLIGDPPRTKALVTTVEPGQDEGRADVRVTLVAPDMARVFTPFVEDVLEAVAQAPSDAEAVQLLLTRFGYWKNLLSGPSSEGLARTGQQGLYGELWCLHHLLLPEMGPTGIEGWTGPDRDDRDFQRGGVGIEVKTTVLDNPPTVQISSERQLNPAPFPTLYLVALALDALPAGGGQTLNSLVDQITDRLADGSKRLEFHDKLLQYGYADLHRPQYEHIHYSLRELWTFKVEDSFPRITEDLVPDGIGKVNYRLSLNACDPWRITPEEVVDRYTA